jgi:hypothetical protein
MSHRLQPTRNTTTTTFVVDERAEVGASRPSAPTADVLPVYTFDGPAPRRRRRAAKSRAPLGDPPTPPPLGTRSVGRRLVAVIALVATGVAATTTILTGPSHPDDVSPATSTPAEAGTLPPKSLAIAPAIVEPCRWVIEIAANALGIDADSYGHVVTAISTIESRSLNAVVHAQLDEALAAVDIPTFDPPRSNLTALQESLSAAVDRTDAAPCPRRDTQPSLPAPSGADCHLTGDQHTYRIVDRSCSRTCFASRLGASSV